MFINSKHKGSFAVAQCIALLYSRGYEVLLPLGDRKCYDLVFDDGYKLFKVQAKYAGMTSKGKCVAGLRITGGNQSYNYAKKYRDDEFDFLYVYTADKRQYLINWSKVKNRNEISINDKKYQQYEVK